MAGPIIDWLDDHDYPYDESWVISHPNAITLLAISDVGVATHLKLAFHDDLLDLSGAFDR